MFDSAKHNKKWIQLKKGLKKHLQLHRSPPTVLFFVWMVQNMLSVSVTADSVTLFHSLCEAVLANSAT